MASGGWASNWCPVGARPQRRPKHLQRSPVGGVRSYGSVECVTDHALVHKGRRRVNVWVHVWAHWFSGP